ncbi:MAG: squalene synthase HpnD [Mycobacterium sp.]|jgi:phytoene synthase|nr:squalene synthase HpnD [Mycobacterium sp.]
MTADLSTLGEAYAECKKITEQQARNFSYGIRLLPPHKRAALSAVYAFARRADDIGDDPELDESVKVLRLKALREVLSDLPAAGSDPVMLALDDTSRRFPLPLDALEELIDGIEMDVTGTTYETFDELVVYCRRVAGTVGRLSLSIFGSGGHPQASVWADELGVALQQTNILRDVREDLGNGRVYLPAEDLKRFDVNLSLDENGDLRGPQRPFEELIRAATVRAEDWYRKGFALLDLLDRRSYACCAAMSGIYHRLNGVIAADPGAVRFQRLSLSGGAKAKVAVRSLAGLRP